MIRYFITTCDEDYNARLWQCAPEDNEKFLKELEEHGFIVASNIRIEGTYQLTGQVQTMLREDHDGGTSHSLELKIADVQTDAQFRQAMAAIAAENEAHDKEQAGLLADEGIGDGINVNEQEEELNPDVND